MVVVWELQVATAWRVLRSDRMPKLTQMQTLANPVLYPSRFSLSSVASFDEEVNVNCSVSKWDGHPLS